MEIRIILKAVGFLLLEVIGLPGNLIILACFVHFRMIHGKFMAIDIILCKLSFINLVVVIIRGIPESLNTLGVQNLFGQQGCNMAIFIYRVSRAMSICMTSLLSCYQCVLLAPSSDLWPAIKQRLIRNLTPIMIGCWCLNVANYLLPMFSMTWPLHQNSTAHVLNLQFCLVVFPAYSVFLLSGIMSISRDVVCISLMALGSFCIVFILYRHKQSAKSIRKSDQGGRNTAEVRAANAVLMLVFTYVFFFGLDNGIWLYSICAAVDVSKELTDARVFFSTCYSALSPLVVIATNKKVQMKLKSAFPGTFPDNLENDVANLSK